MTKHLDDFLAKSMVSNWIQPESDFSELRGMVNKQVAHFAQQRFIGNQQELAVTSDHLITQLRMVDRVFSRFEKELDKVDSDIYRELIKQSLNFRA